jgi:hypothetical protein
MLAVLILVVAGAGGFVGLLYGGGLSLGTKTVTETTYQPVTITPETSTQAANQFVFIEYYCYPYSSYGSYKPQPGYTILFLYLKMQNQGYDIVPIASHSGSYNFYLVANYAEQFNPIYLSGLKNALPMTDLLNGLRTYGYITFEIPSDYLDYPIRLIYKPETGNYNVQSVNVGVEGAKEKVSLESYDWTDLNHLVITLRNDGQFTNVTFGDNDWLYQGAVDWLYVNGVSPGGYETQCSLRSNPYFVYTQLPPHETCTFTFIGSIGFAPAKGTAYVLKVVTTTRNTFSFSIIAGQKS